MTIHEIASAIVAQHDSIQSCFAAVQACHLRSLEAQGLALAVAMALREKLTREVQQAYHAALEG